MIITQSSDSHRYGSLARAFHWITAILVLVAFIYGPGGSELRVYMPSRDFKRQLHETLGMAVFAISLARIAWALFDQRPKPIPMPQLMRVASKAVQGLIYLLLMAVPVTAVLGAWLEGHPLTMLAGIEVASPIAASHDTGVSIATLHTWLGDAILWLAGFHAIAAIYHHTFLKDDVLAAMLPKWLKIPRL